MAVLGSIFCVVIRLSFRFVQNAMILYIFEAEVVRLSSAGKFPDGVPGTLKRLWRVPKGTTPGVT